MPSFQGGNTPAGQAEQAGKEAYDRINSMPKPKETGNRHNDIMRMRAYEKKKAEAIDQLKRSNPAVHHAFRRHENQQNMASSSAAMRQHLGNARRSTDFNEQMGHLNNAHKASWRHLGDSVNNLGFEAGSKYRKARNTVVGEASKAVGGVVQSGMQSNNRLVRGASKGANIAGKAALSAPGKGLAKEIARYGLTNHTEMGRMGEMAGLVRGSKLSLLKGKIMNQKYNQEDVLDLRNRGQDKQASWGHAFGQGAAAAASTALITAGVVGANKLYDKIQTERIWKRLKEEHPELTSSPKDRETFETLQQFNPAIASNIATARSYMARMKHTGMTPHEFIGDLARIQSSVDQNSMGRHMIDVAKGSRFDYSSDAADNLAIKREMLDLSKQKFTEDKNQRALDLKQRQEEFNQRAQQLKAQEDQRERHFNQQINLKKREFYHKQVNDRNSLGLNLEKAEIQRLTGLANMNKSLMSADPARFSDPGQHQAYQGLVGNVADLHSIKISAKRPTITLKRSK